MARPPWVLLLACIGLVAVALAPGSWLVALPLLFVPGWGLLRLLSVIDRNLGVAGASLCLSTLVLGLLSWAAETPSETLRTLVSSRAAAPALALLLVILGAWRLARHDRWQTRQPPHPAPMPLWPARTWALALVVVAALAACLWALRPSAPAAGPLLDEAAQAAALLRGGEQPFGPGLAVGRAPLLPHAAATLARATGVDEVTATALLVASSLLAMLLLVAEAASRLWGNRGGTRAAVAALLGLAPLSLFAGEEGLTTALDPFLRGQSLALALAFLALLLSSTCSVLRRATTHVPRLAGVAALGLLLAAPAAALLLLPGWLFGLLLSHLACRASPDNRPGGDARRAGEPAVLRAPFWRLALPLALAAGSGAWLVDLDLPAGEPRLSAALTLVLALGPASLLFLPGTRHLHRSPGREAFFFIGLTVTSVLLAVGWNPARDDGTQAARLLALLLAVPAAVGASRLVERFGTPARAALVLAALVLAAGPWLAARAAGARPPALVRDQARWHLAPGLVPPELGELLEVVARRAPAGAVTIIAELPGDAAAASSLVACRTLLTRRVGAGLGPRLEAACSALDAGDAAGALALRGLPELAGRSTWIVHEAPGWPGLADEDERGELVLQSACGRDIVLVTVSGLRADRLDPAHMPELAALAARGVRFEQALTPRPDELPGLLALLGDAPVEPIDAALAARGLRTAAVVALTAPELEGLRPHGFERVVALPGAPCERLVDAALVELAAADSRPLFLWLHLGDLVPPLRPTAGASADAEAFPADGDLDALHFGVALDPLAPPDLVAAPPRLDLAAGTARYDALAGEIDRALGRLLLALADDDLVVVTAPHGTSLLEHEAYLDHGRDLFEPSVRVPLVVAGAGLAAMRREQLASLADLAALLLRGRWPERESVVLESRLRPGLATGRSHPPDLDPTSRGAASRIWGLRTATGKLLLLGPATGLFFDLARDPEEQEPLPADPDALRALEAWRGQHGAPLTETVRSSSSR